MTEEEFRRKKYGHKYRKPPRHRISRDAEDVLSWEHSYVARQLVVGTSNRRQVKAFERILHLVVDNELTPRQSEIAKMCYFEEYNCTEIACALGLSVSSVVRTLHRAECRIRLHLKYCLMLLRISNEEDDDD